MHENAVSYRMKQQNLLKSKVQIFQSNYQEARQRMSSTSSMSVLAGTVYAHKQNKLMTPKKALKRPLSASMLARVNENPEILKSQALKGLNTRASHIANYSDINTELLLQKKNLQEHVLFLKDEILKEKKLKNRAEMNTKKIQNQLEHSRNQIKELEIKSGRLNDAINQTRQDLQDNKRQLADRLNNNSEKNANIQLEIKYTNQLENRCRQLKNQTLIQEKNRTNSKAQLIKQQRVMAAGSIFLKELEQERANLLLEINKNVEKYKLE